MEDERIKTVKSWPKLKLLQDIQVFIEFVNFYQHFIQEFSKITALLTSILKTSSAASTPSQKSMMVNDETSKKNCQSP